jgi:hypothetical protein
MLPAPNVAALAGIARESEGVGSAGEVPRKGTCSALFGRIFCFSSRVLRLP